MNNGSTKLKSSLFHNLLILHDLPTEEFIYHQLSAKSSPQMTNLVWKVSTLVDYQSLELTCFQAAGVIDGTASSKDYNVETLNGI